MIDIKIIDEDVLLNIWSNHLWPNRKSKIELTSAIMFGNFPYTYDMSFMHEKEFLFGAFKNNVLVGVNSGHRTDTSFRSRGLFVFPEYRGNNIGCLLLNETIAKARELKLEFAWSMPRQSSIKVYENSGFVKSSEWFNTETSISNCFVRIDI